MQQRSGDGSGATAISGSSSSGTGISAGIVAAACAGCSLLCCRRCSLSSSILCRACDIALIIDSAEELIVPGVGIPDGSDEDGDDSGCDGLGIDPDAKGLNACSLFVVAFCPVDCCCTLGCRKSVNEGLGVGCLSDGGNNGIGCDGRGMNPPVKHGKAGDGKP